MECPFRAFYRNGIHVGAPDTDSAMIFPEVKSVRDPKYIEILQDQTHLMLYEYVFSQKAAAKVGSSSVTTTEVKKSI